MKGRGNELEGVVLHGGLLFTHAVIKRVSETKFFFYKKASVLNLATFIVIQMATSH